jgi:DNA-binding NarL/FixJ family response regulator
VIVDDNSLIVDAIRMGLRASDEFKLVGCANGRTTAARTILDAQPDAILLDDMDQSERSIELLRGIRSKDQNVALVLLSIRLVEDWLDRVFRAGATAVISKATQPAAVATLVRETLNGHIVHRPSQTPERSPAVAAADLPLTLVDSAAASERVLCIAAG